MNKLFAALLIATGLLAGPARADDAPLRIGVSAGPYGEILEFTSKIAEKEGLKAKIIEFSDYNGPDAALAAGDLDANNYQHIPFLENQIKNRGYPIVAVAKSIVVPLGIYSHKLTSLDQLKTGAPVALPNDPTNGARALALFEELGLIKLTPGVGLNATLADIVDNPKKLKFVELDAAQIPRSLDDVDAAAATLNYAVLAGLDPKKALALENEKSKWHLVWAVRKGDENNPRIRRFIEIYQSDEVKNFILTRFQGTILPAW